MKKSELKNIIKECVKEVIFEEGVLSGIIAEVAQGLGSIPTLVEAKKTPSSTSSPERERIREALVGDTSRHSYDEAKKRFEDPSLFEGTAPIPSTDGHNPMSGVAPGDRGVEISNIPGFSNWGTVAQNLK
jgi:hypothetical protein